MNGLLLLPLICHWIWHRMTNKNRLVIWRVFTKNRSTFSAEIHCKHLNDNGETITITEWNSSVLSKTICTCYYYYFYNFYFLRFDAFGTDQLRLLSTGVGLTTSEYFQKSQHNLKLKCSVYIQVVFQLMSS